MLPLELASLVLFAVMTLVLTLYFILIMVFKPAVDSGLGPLIEHARHRKLPREDRELMEPIKPREPLQTSEDRELIEPIKPREPSQTRQTANVETEEKECPHYIGFLTTLPEGLPFPDECFGCRKVVQCLRIEPAHMIENFYVSSAYEQ